MSIEQKLEKIIETLRQEVPDLSCTTFDGETEIFDRLSEIGEMVDNLLEATTTESEFIIFNKDVEDLFVSFSIIDDTLEVLDNTDYLDLDSGE